MPLFVPRSSSRPRRAIRRRFDQRPAVRIGAAVAGACLVAAAVAGSLFQSSSAEDNADSEKPTPATVSPASTFQPTTAPSASVTPRATQSPRPSPFWSCDEVRAAGADPLRRGDPGYGPHLDRNGNGLACEPV